MAADTAIEPIGVVAAPAAWLLPPGTDIVIRSIRAHFDGTSAATPFIPVVQLILPNGDLGPEFPLSSGVAAGASADVTWFPRLGGGGGGGGGVTGNAQVRVPLITPDNTSYAFPSLSTANGFTSVRLVLPYLSQSQDSFWTGSIPVPQNYKASPVVIISTVANANTGAVRWIVGSNVVPAGSSEDAAFTDETAQNITVPGTALFRKDVTFAITGSTPVAGSTLNIRVKRNGSNVADTCTVAAAVWETIFQYQVS